MSEQQIHDITLTPEQLAIINSTGNIKINAVAGSGKTTTVIQYAKTRPPKSRILYLAYNKSVKQEAKRKFTQAGLKNVTVETAHSLAYRYIIREHRYQLHPKGGYKTYEIAEILGLTSHSQKHGEYILATHINKLITLFCNSNKQKVQDLNYLGTISDPKAITFVRNFYPAIESGARLLLKKMNDGDIEIIHDFYLKKFQLSKPALPFDYILFDEGQDASPAMLDVFLNQQATRVIVGDSHQQIYSWRHAINSMETADFKDYNLTTSFRFSQSIADLAMKTLDWKSHLGVTNEIRIYGKGKNSGTQQKATLARTNLGLLLRAITYITDHPEVTHIHFEGNINSYTYADDGASLYDVLNLSNQKTDRIRDKLIQSMKDLDDLEDYIEKTDDVQLAMMVEIVKEYGNEIPEIISTLKSMQVKDDERHKAEMVFSTVHKAKGMEYDAVQLVEDFVTETKLERLSKERKDDEELNFAKWNEEINLLYVAITRTKNMLRIPESLLPKNYTPAKNIIVLKEKKEEESHHKISKPSPSHKPAATQTKEKTYSVEKVRSKHKDAYRPWSPALDDELRQLFHNGIPMYDMAHHFGRTQGAIISRLKKIGCVES